MHRARVLLVDDDPHALEVLRGLLANHGLALVWEEVHEAPDTLAFSGAPHPRLDALLEAVERAHILAALRLTHWNKSQAARCLGMRRTTLLHRLRALDIPFAPVPAEHAS
jgi:DNA-binding NtrC family response regulator